MHAMKKKTSNTAPSRWLCADTFYIFNPPPPACPYPPQPLSPPPAWPSDNSAQTRTPWPAPEAPARPMASFLCSILYSYKTLLFIIIFISVLSPAGYIGTCTPACFRPPAAHPSQSLLATPALALRSAVPAYNGSNLRLRKGDGHGSMRIFKNK